MVERKDYEADMHWYKQRTTRWSSARTFIDGSAGQLKQGRTTYYSNKRTNSMLSHSLVHLFVRSYRAFYWIIELLYSKLLSIVLAKSGEESLNAAMRNTRI
ncbi:unnamed protein product (mitochondrion) [Musa textilis]